MHPFDYTRADDVASAGAAVTTDAIARAVQHPGDAAFIAGGTTQLDLMRDGVWSPGTLVDISRLPLADVTVEDDVPRRRCDGHHGRPGPARRGRAALDVLRDSLLLAASPQLRTMATVGGNVLQRTRCRYFRDPTVTRCNKREPGTGCAAVEGTARMHAVLGVDAGCIAVHASDLAVALVALDARVRLQGPDGVRTVPVGELHVRADDDPSRDNVLAPGELLTHLEVPAPGRPHGLPQGPRPRVLRVRAHLCRGRRPHRGRRGGPHRHRPRRGGLGAVARHPGRGGAARPARVPGPLRGGRGRRAGATPSRCPAPTSSPSSRDAPSSASCATSRR